MGHHVTKQPNGKYAIFSSIVDHFTAYDATPEEIRDHFRAEAIEESDRQTKRSMERADYLNEARFEVDIEAVARIHGQPEADKYREMLSRTADDRNWPCGHLKTICDCGWKAS